MINITTPTKSPLADITRNLPQRFRREFNLMVRRDIVPIIQVNLVRDLVNKTPPKRTPGSPKFIWNRNKRANDRARRWWFKAIADGRVNTDGSNYIRSGKLQKAWTVLVVVKVNVATISVSNSARGAEYVYGNRERPQIPGHRTTGWPSVNRQIAGKVRSLDSKIGQAVDGFIDRVLA